MGQPFSVRQLPTRGSRTLPGWRELLCSRVTRVDVASLTGDRRCVGTLSEVSAGDVRVDRVEVRAAPYVVRHVVPGHTEVDGPVVVCVLVRGECVVRQDGREAAVHPGDLVLFDTARSYEVIYPAGDHTHVALRVPRDVLQQTLVTLDNLTAVTVAGSFGMGAAVSPLLAALHAALPTVGAPAGRRLIGHALDLVGSAFGFADPPRPADREQHLLRAERFIRCCLDDDDLSPATVAEAVNVSVGHLHRLFRGTGVTVRQSILRARLDRCSQELRETAHADETVAEIAFRHGFKDAAHFTRAFVRRYGVTPTQWRSG